MLIQHYTDFLEEESYCIFKFLLIYDELDSLTEFKNARRYRSNALDGRQYAPLGNRRIKSVDFLLPLPLNEPWVEKGLCHRY